MGGLIQANLFGLSKVLRPVSEVFQGQMGNLIRYGSVIPVKIRVTGKGNVRFLGRIEVQLSLVCM